MFITFEGPEGSGKSTQITLLAETLEQAGWTVLSTREPGGVAVAERLREIVLHDKLTSEAEALIFLAARAEHAHSRILPALAAGKIVLCDRFSDSTLAYQGYGLGLDLELLRSLCTFAESGAKPDVTLLMDLDPAIGLSRRFGAQPMLDLGLQGAVPGSQLANRMEHRGIDFHQRVHKGFLAEADLNRDRIAVIDASQSIKQVRTRIWSEVKRRLPARRKSGGSG